MKYWKYIETKKQEAYGPHRSPEKQFKSTNTYDYVITLIKRIKKKTLLTSWESIGSSFEQTWIPFTQGCFVPSFVEIGPVFFLCHQCIFGIS